MLMQPENNPTSQYDFIMNPSKPVRLGGGNKKTKILIIIIAVVTLITLGAFAYSLISSSGQTEATGFVSLAQKQTEIIRIAAIGNEKSTSIDTKVLAIATELSFTSSQAQFTKIIKDSGTKVTPALLGGAKDALADTKLSSASSSGAFDQAFNEVLTAKLTDYQVTLKSVQASSTSTKEKQLLQTSLAQVNTILNTK